MKQSILNNVYAYVETQVRSAKVLNEARKRANLSVPVEVPAELDWDINMSTLNEYKGHLRARAEFYFGDNHKGCIDIHVTTIGNTVDGKWELMLDYTAKVCAQGKLPADPSAPMLKEVHKRAA
ncbi:MAG: hypothetical protein DI585_04705 [Pseudomonas fluorescens]|nr:MAG: hypothetical protein DI585_04705 [Pseudomonas fluorescens]